MAWPYWIVKLKENYLENTASVFLLWGDGVESQWPADGDTGTAVQVTAHMLRKTRAVVGVLKPNAPLAFLDFTDEDQFERALRVGQMLSGTTEIFQAKVPEHAPIRMWRAMHATQTPQGYLICDLHKFLPARRRRIQTYGNIPNFVQWIDHPIIRENNHIIVAFAPSLDSVHPDFVAKACCIEITHRQSLPPPPAALDEIWEPLSMLEEDSTPDEIPEHIEEQPPPMLEIAEPDSGEINVAQQSASSPTPTVVPATTEAGSIASMLAEALAAELSLQAVSSTLPVARAVAHVLHTFIPEWSTVELSVDSEGHLIQLHGTGFLSLWRSDIAMRSASEALVAELNTSKGLEGAIESAAFKALYRRVMKMLATLDAR